MPPFVPGLELSGRFYRDAVRPIVGALPHSAALIGPGSDVLGFDTERSTDHDWGPRVLLFLRPADVTAQRERLDAALATGLPPVFLGYPTHFVQPAGGSAFMAPADGPISHRVVITDLDTWCGGWLGFDPRDRVDLLDWLATPTQRLAEFTGGAVFHDGLGQLEPARERLRWYPPDVWRYVLAAQWQRIAEEEPFAGRCTELGDAVGGRIVEARLLRDLVRLRLLMRKVYPPYPKWLGTAAARYGVTEWDLTAAATEQNGLGLTAPLDTSIRPFHDRPYQVLGAGRFAEALHRASGQLADLPLLGAIDQFADSTPLTGDMSRCRAVTAAALGL